MMWPWKTSEAEDTRLQEVDAEKKDQAAEARQREAERLAAQSRSVTHALRREIDKNGWTELLQAAWKGRA